MTTTITPVVQVGVFAASDVMRIIKALKQADATDLVPWFTLPLALNKDAFNTLSEADQLVCSS